MSGARRAEARGGGAAWGARHAARIALAVAGRELGAFAQSAIAIAVAVAFLVVQGLSFWAVVEVLSDPQRQAPYGAVLEAHFGGTVLSWAALFAVVAALSMRLIADEKRQGTWELLLTAPVPEGAAVVGKWLGAVAFGALLWLPTLAYPVVLALYLPDGASLDLGPVLSAYAGVIFAMAGFLALGTAASAATNHQLVAAVATFSALLALLVAGQAAELAPSWLEGRGGLEGALAAVDIRGHLEGFASGAVPLTGIVFFAGMIAAGLAIAGAAATAGRRRRSEFARRAIAAALVCAIAALALALAARADRTYDVTAARAHSLEAETEAVLARVDRDIEVIVLPPRAEVFDPVYDEARRILGRMEREEPRLERREFEPAREPERAVALAEEFSIAPGDLAEGGAVIFDSGDRRRAVELLEMAEFDYDELGAGAISKLRAEEAFAEALADVARRERPVVCFTSQRGEMPLEGGDGGPDLGPLAGALERAGLRPRDVGDLSDGVPSSCAALAVAGPGVPLGADAAAAIEAHLDGGGGLFVAARRDIGARSLDLPETGLELVLAERGIGLPDEVALDPARALDGAGLWSAVEGYGEHPITAGFEGRKATGWRWPRAVNIEVPEGAEGEALVSTSAAGFATSRGEVLDEERPVREAEDREGPIAVAAAVSGEGGEKIAALGTAEALAAEVAGGAADANRALAASAIAWVAGAQTELEIGPKTPERVRLVMTERQRRAVFAICVGGLPLAFAGAGLLAWWWRRREGARG